ncbi:MAG: energy transducer TonB, partial [Owenweeksia sp.]
MDLKKNPGANLESKRGVFFLIGLSIALLAAITVIQWKSELFLEKPPQPGDIVYQPGPVIPITVHKVAEAASKKEEKSSADKIRIVDKIIKQIIDVPKPIDPDPEGGEPLDPVDREPDDGPSDDEGIETIMPLLVQKMALPFACTDLTDKEEQQDCFNKWMANYLRKNIKYPDGAKRLGLEDRVFVTFVINHEGKVENIKVNNGEYEDLNREAERVISELPAFSPASHFGRKVKM